MTVVSKRAFGALLQGITRLWMERCETLWGITMCDVIPEKMQLIIASIRSRLKMDMACITDFTSGNNVVQFAEGNSRYLPGLQGSEVSLNESYCYLFAQGVLPSIIADTSLHAATKDLDLTEKLEIGSYIAAPLRGPDGTIYGVFSCLGHSENYSLGDRELSMMAVFADMAGVELKEQITKKQNYLEAQQRIREVMTPEKLHIRYQPIYDLKKQRVMGYESLARFDTEPYQTPDIWFQEAKSVGLDQELELLAIKRGIEGMQYIDESAYISLNVSAEIIMSGLLTDVFSDEIAPRIVLEVTEHSRVPDYKLFRKALCKLRKKGLRLAVDDAGAGFASFQHILELGAEIIKLDISLIKGLDKDPARSALTSALISFSKDTDTMVIAEGVETQEEYSELLRIGVDNIQGYYVGYPMPVEQVIFYTPTIGQH